MVTIERWQEDIYILEEARVRAFLLLGADEAVLVDTCFADSGVAAAVRALTAQPLRVVLTHGDRDHTGGLVDFSACWLHPGDWPQISAQLVRHPLCDGEVIVCGDSHWQVVALPGHTAGSVAFWERTRELLLIGDVVQKDSPVYMFGEKRDLAGYIASLEKLQRLIPSETLLLPSHGAYPLSADWIEKTLQDARALRDGRLTRAPHPALSCAIASGQWAQFLVDG